MLQGFKSFVMRGNVIDLAVAVILGTAFTKVIGKITDGLVNPIMAMFGKPDELGLGFRLMSDKPATFIALGPIISAIIDFLMVAAVLYFILILPMNTIKKRQGLAIAENKSDNELLTEIRDLLNAGVRR